MELHDLELEYQRYQRKQAWLDYFVWSAIFAVGILIGFAGAIIWRG